MSGGTVADPKQLAEQTLADYSEEWQNAVDPPRACVVARALLSALASLEEWEQAAGAEAQLADEFKAERDRYREVLRGLMDALTIHEDGNLTGAMDQWADAWCEAVAVLTPARSTEEKRDG